jgi:hypothetical protein
MSVPMALWALGTWAAGAATAKGGELFGKHKMQEADAVLTRAQQYVLEAERSFARKRRAYLERMQSYMQMIRVAFDPARVGAVTTRAELPESLRELWALMLADMGRLAPEGFFSQPLQDQPEIAEPLKYAIVASRYLPNLREATAIATGAVFAFDGARKAIDGARYYEQATAMAAKARQAADAQLQSLERLQDDLHMRWDNIVVPLLATATTDPRMARALLDMADEFSAVSATLMKEDTDAA